MKLYIAARFKGLENKSEIEKLCSAVKAAGMEDFCFIRDVENYQPVFSDLKELWRRAKQEIEDCDALLIDVSDAPTGGRVVEAGIAYGLGKPVIVIVQAGTEYRPFFDGVAAEVISYKRYNDIIEPLRPFL